jgi:hypothetical protein
MRIAFAQAQIYLLEMDSDSVNPYYTMAKFCKLTDFWNNVKTYWENQLKYNLYHTGDYKEYK